VQSQSHFVKKDFKTNRVARQSSITIDDCDTSLNVEGLVEIFTRRKALSAFNVVRYFLTDCPVRPTFFLSLV